MPEDQLGLVFLLHGLSTLALVALASTHIYFALRPEKIFYTRSMLAGWMSEDEMAANHDQPNGRLKRPSKLQGRRHDSDSTGMLVIETRKRCQARSDTSFLTV